MRLSEGKRLALFTKKKRNDKNKKDEESLWMIKLDGNVQIIHLQITPEKKVIDGVAANILMDQYKWVDFLATSSSPQIKLEKDHIKFFQIILGFMTINNLVMTQREI